MKFNFVKNRLVQIICVAITILIFAELFGPGGIQRRQIKAAVAYRDTAMTLLAADSRFSAIDLNVTTKPDLRVSGEVPDQKALQDLKRLIQPPEDAAFGFRMAEVKVLEPSATRPVE